MVRACKFILAGCLSLLLLCAGATGIASFIIGDTNPPSGTFVATSAGREHVLDVGPDFAVPAAAPAIVLLHGATANLEDMRLALGDRLRASYRVIAIDRPGSGWSERKNGAADADPHRQAEVVHEVLSKSGVQRPILVAHSWAGSVALDYALAYPQELRGLVLLAPVAYRWSGEFTRDARLVTTPWLGTLFVHTLALPIGWFMFDEIVDRAFSPERPPPDYVDNAEILLALRPDAITASAEDIAEMDQFPAPQSSPYKRVTVPTVIVDGAEDHMVPSRQQGEVLARQLPQAKLITLPKVGHMPHYAAPDRIFSVITSLVAMTRADNEVDRRD